MQCRFRRFFLAMAAWLAFSGPVHAGDTVQSFEMLGTLHSGVEIGGTLLVDLSTGRAIAAHIQIYGQHPYFFDHVALQESYGFAYVITLTASNPDGCPVFIFGERDRPLNLQDYRGGYLGPASNIRYCDGFVDHVTYGSLTLLH